MNSNFIKSRHIGRLVIWSRARALSPAVARISEAPGSVRVRDGVRNSIHPARQSSILSEGVKVIVSGAAWARTIGRWFRSLCHRFGQTNCQLTMCILRHRLPKALVKADPFRIVHMFLRPTEKRRDRDRNDSSLSHAHGPEEGWMAGG